MLLKKYSYIPVNNNRITIRVLDRMRYNTDLYIASVSRFRWFCHYKRNMMHVWWLNVHYSNAKTNKKIIVWWGSITAPCRTPHSILRYAQSRTGLDAVLLCHSSSIKHIILVKLKISTIQLGLVPISEWGASWCPRRSISFRSPRRSIVLIGFSPLNIAVIP